MGGAVSKQVRINAGEQKARDEMAPSETAKSQSDAANVTDKSSAGGFLFVQYPSDARLGRKHLQSKSMKEHLSRRRRIQKIHKFRNINVPVAPSNASESDQIPPDISYHTGLVTPRSLPSADNEPLDVPEIEERSQELWDNVDWEPFRAARQREQASQLSPTSGKSSSPFDAPFVIRSKSPSNNSDPPSISIHKEENVMDPWNTGWTMFAAVGAKVPVKMDSDAYTILQHHFRMPEISYQLRGDSPLILHRDAAFPLGCKTPANWYAMMATASAHRDALAGRGKSTITLAYEAKALAGAREHIADPKLRYQPITYLIVLCSANTARMTGVETFKTHILGLSQIWNAMGGVPTMIKAPECNLVATAILLVLSKSQVMAEDELHFEGKLTYDYVAVVRQRIHDLLSLIAELVRCCKPTSPGNRLDVIFTFCRKSTWLHPIVAPSEEVQSVSTGALRARERDGQRANDIFILLSFCQLVLRYRREPQKCLSLLSLLGQRLKASTGQAGTNKYIVVWHLISGVNEGPNARVWQVVDMVRAMHWFSLTSQNRILQALSAPFLSAYMSPHEILNDEGLAALQAEANEILRHFGSKETLQLPELFVTDDT